MPIRERVSNALNLGFTSAEIAVRAISRLGARLFDLCVLSTVIDEDAYHTLYLTADRSIYAPLNTLEHDSTLADDAS